MPIRLSCSIKSSVLSSARKPGMDSNLSMVPPLYPKPRPDILPTSKPQAATIGPIVRVVLSPTPPVECLSTINVPNDERSSTSPECAMASVKWLISSWLMPFSWTAIAHAAIW